MLEFLQGFFTLSGAAIALVVADCGHRYLAISEIGLGALPD
jgi:hypothetical protein